MAELPDLQVFADDFNKHFAGKKLLKLKIVNAKKFKDKPAELVKRLTGKVLKKIYRSGKELRFEFEDATLLGMHLMLRGDIFSFKKTDEPPYTLIAFYFEGGSGIALADRMKNANIKLEPVDKKGVDAVSKALNFKYLTNAFKTKRVIKDVLMDQDIIRGIGNTYSDEILWQCKLSPFSIAEKIPDEKIKELAKAIKKVLNQATKNIHSVYIGKAKGEIKDFLKVHTRDNPKSPTGGDIKIGKIGGRKAYYTDEQVVYK